MQGLGAPQQAGLLGLRDQREQHGRMALVERAHEAPGGGFAGTGIDHQMGQEAAVVDQPAHQLQQHAAQGLARIGGAVDAELQLRHQRCVPALDQGLEIGVAGAEVVDEAAQVGVGPGRHRAHGQRLEAAAPGQHQAGAQQALAAVGLGAAGTAGHGLEFIRVYKRRQGPAIGRRRSLA